MVQSLLDFNDKLQMITTEAFLADQSISRASKLAFSQLVNRRQNKPAELVSKYIDQILKAGNKKYNEDELDTTLDKLMILFRSIQSKDIFEAYVTIVRPVEALRRPVCALGPRPLGRERDCGTPDGLTGLQTH